MDDWEAIRRYVHGGDQGAFACLVERYAGAVFAACRRQVVDRGMAEDATQAVFMALAKSAGRLKEGTVVAGWLFTAARHCCANMRRRSAARQVHEADAGRARAAARDRAAGHAGEWEEVAAMLDDAIDSLGRGDRELVLQRYFRQQDFAAAAAELEIGEAAARKRVSRAIARLRDYYRSRGVAISAEGLTAGLSAGLCGPMPAGLTSRIASAVFAGTTNATVAGLTKGLVTTMGSSVAKVVSFGAIGAAACLIGGVAIVAGARGSGGTGGPGSAGVAPATQGSGALAAEGSAAEDARRLAKARDYAGALARYGAYLEALPVEQYRDKKDFGWLLKAYEEGEGGQGKVDYAVIAKVATDAMGQPGHKPEIWGWRLQRFLAQIFEKWGNRKGMGDRLEAAIEKYPNVRYGDASKLSSLQHLYNERGMMILADDGPESAEKFVAGALAEDRRFTYFFAKPWLDAYRAGGHAGRIPALVGAVSEAYKEKVRRDPAVQAAMEEQIKALRAEAGLDR